AMLKHPLCRLGRLPGAWKTAIERLELAVLRGTRPPAGSAGLLREFNRFRDELAKVGRKEVSALHHAEPRARLKAEDLDRIQALIDALRQALAPIETLPPSKPYDFAELAHRHREILIESLSAA